MELLDSRNRLRGPAVLLGVFACGFPRFAGAQQGRRIGMSPMVSPIRESQHGSFHFPFPSTPRLSLTCCLGSFHDSAAVLRIACSRDATRWADVYREVRNTYLCPDHHPPIPGFEDVLRKNTRCSMLNTACSVGGLTSYPNIPQNESEYLM